MVNAESNQIFKYTKSHGKKKLFRIWSLKKLLNGQWMLYAFVVGHIKCNSSKSKNGLTTDHTWLQRWHSKILFPLSFGKELDWKSITKCFKIRIWSHFYVQLWKLIISSNERQVVDKKVHRTSSASITKFWNFDCLLIT